MKKAVIFDLDDTLISEDEYIRSGFAAVSRFLEDMYGWDVEPEDGPTRLA